MRKLTTAAIAAKEIRERLKQAGIKATVKSSNFAGGDSVDIHLTDATPPEVAKAKEICGPYQYGHFDGMTDCYEYSNKRSDLPQAKYVHVHEDTSEELEALIYDFLRANFAGGDKLPETYSRRDHTSRICDDWVSSVIWRQYINADSPFWKHVANS